MITARNRRWRTRRSPGTGLVPCIPFDRTSRIPYYTQIYNWYREAIITGRLASGQRLPSTRALAHELQISRFPVFSAFEQLLHDGYLEGVIGSGTYVSEQIPDDFTKPITVRTVQAHSPEDAASQPRPTGDELPDDRLGPFAVSTPALDKFPHLTFSRLVRHHAGNESTELFAYGDPAGYLPLREAIADYLRTARAVDCDASRVLVVGGSQMGLIISAIALTGSEASVCIEEPGYPGTQRALEISGAQVAHIPVDDQGIDVAAIKRLTQPVSVVYITPSHQYPLGVALEMTRRLELLSWAARHNVWIIEDDYDSEYRYSTRPLGALQGMSTHDRVIYLGTFSKVLFPRLRLGYIVVPPALLSSFIDVRKSLDICPSMLYQLVLTDFINEGHFGRHLLRMRALYLSRRNALIAAIQESAADVLTPGNIDAGLHLVALLPSGVNDQDVVRRAADRGLYPKALSTCYAGSAARSGLILGFGGSDAQVLPGAVSTLAELIRSMC